MARKSKNELVLFKGKEHIAAYAPDHYGGVVRVYKEHWSFILGKDEFKIDLSPDGSITFKPRVGDSVVIRLPGNVANGLVANGSAKENVEALLFALRQLRNALEESERKNPELGLRYTPSVGAQDSLGNIRAPTADAGIEEDISRITRALSDIEREWARSARRN